MRCGEHPQPATRKGYTQEQWNGRASCLEPAYALAEDRVGAQSGGNRSAKHTKYIGQSDHGRGILKRRGNP